jgi:hypothetical protein
MNTSFIIPLISRPRPAVAVIGVAQLFHAVSLAGSGFPGQIGLT